MHQSQEPTDSSYPHGRGYGHDYMRGGEVLGGYGYSAREEYDRTRGELHRDEADDAGGGSAPGEIRS
jgi:hypothetical protein